jgi:hypothetical protein
VTVLRSPSATAEFVASAETVMFPVPNDDIGDWMVTLLALSAVPQSPQKRLLGGFSAPHFGQWLASGAPQSAQNFLPAGLSLPHFEQRTYSPLAQRFGPHLSPRRRCDYSYVRVKAGRDPHWRPSRNSRFVRRNLVILHPGYL